MKLKLILFLFLFCLSGIPVSLFADTYGVQSHMKPDTETHCYLHLNKTFYVSGETIYYKLYFPKRFVGKRTVVAATLYNSNHQMIDRSYIRLEDDRTANGFYKIPFEWTSAMCRLVFTTTEQLETKTIILAEATIPIYNDFNNESMGLANQKEQLATSSIKPSDQPDASLQFDDQLSINLSTNQSNYSYKEKARLKIKITDRAGKPVKATLSLSVTDAILNSTNGIGLENIFTGAPWNPHWVPDSVVVYKGRTLKEKRRKTAFDNILMAYLPGVQQPVYTQIESDGTFLLLVPEFYEDKDIQFLNYDAKRVGVELEGIMVDSKKLPPLQYTPEIHRYLDLSARRKKIYQLYGALENVAPEKKIPPPTNRLEPDWLFRLDEYESFESIPAFFKEVLAPLKFRNSRKKGFHARMFDPTQPVRKFYEGDPVFIIDDQMTTDPKYIADIDIAKVEQVDLYFVFNKLRTQFGPLGYNGVVVIHSRNKDLEVPNSNQKSELVFYGFQAPLNYPITFSVSTDMPWLSPNVYWSPTLETNSKGELEVEIPNGSDASTFLIDLVAQDRNGNMGRAQKTYEVKRKLP